MIFTSSINRVTMNRGCWTSNESSSRTKCVWNLPLDRIVGAGFADIFLWWAVANYLLDYVSEMKLLANPAQVSC